MDKRRKLGSLGENLAAELLQLEGYAVIQQNYTCKYGEIDIVAEKGDELFFVEVKTRRSDAFGEPAQSVTAVKRRHMKRAANNYLSAHKGLHSFYSFLVIEIGINTIENAF